MHPNVDDPSETSPWNPMQHSWLAPVTYISPQAEAAHMIAKSKTRSRTPIAATAALAAVGTVAVMVAAVVLAHRSGLRLQHLNADPSPFGVGPRDDTANDTDQE